MRNDHAKSQKVTKETKGADEGVRAERVSSLPSLPSVGDRFFLPGLDLRVEGWPSRVRSAHARLGDCTLMESPHRLDQRRRVVRRGRTDEVRRARQAGPGGGNGHEFHRGAVLLARVRPHRVSHGAITRGWPALAGREGLVGVVLGRCPRLRWGRPLACASGSPLSALRVSAVKGLASRRKKRLFVEPQTSRVRSKPVPGSRSQVGGWWR